MGLLWSRALPPLWQPTVNAVSVQRCDSVRRKWPAHKAKNSFRYRTSMKKLLIAEWNTWLANRVQWHIRMQLVEIYLLIRNYLTSCTAHQSHIHTACAAVALVFSQYACKWIALDSSVSISKPDIWTSSLSINSLHGHSLCMIQLCDSGARVCAGRLTRRERVILVKAL